MKPLIFFIYGASSLNKTIKEQTQYEFGDITLRQFPDDETYIKFNSDVKGRSVVIIATMDRPNQKILPLIFAAETAKELGATKIGLIAPYLGYMRQDKRFQEGEGITSTYFASLLSQYFNWIVTVDPHLHRRHSMNEIYTIPALVLHATSMIAHWIKQNTKLSFLIGPDKESEQWVAEIAREVNIDYVILEKIRLGDKEVEINLPDLSKYKKMTPILVDDVISTGRTLGKAAQMLKELKMKPPIAIGVHAVFSEDAYNYLLQSGISKLITCNTIEHFTNEIDLGKLIINCIDKNVKRV